MEYEEIKELNRSEKSAVHLVREKNPGGGNFCPENSERTARGIQCTARLSSSFFAEALRGNGVG